MQDGEDHTVSADAEKERLPQAGLIGKPKEKIIGHREDAVNEHDHHQRAHPRANHHPCAYQKEKHPHPHEDTVQKSITPKEGFHLLFPIPLEALVR